MQTKYLVGFIDDENELRLQGSHFDTFEDANEYAKEMDQHQPAFTFTVYKVVPA